MRQSGFFEAKPNRRRFSGIFSRFSAVFLLLLLLAAFLPATLAGCGEREGEREISYPTYEQAEDYVACSEFRYISSKLQKIVIDWIDGEIHLVQGTSSTFAVRETSAGLSDGQKLHYFQDGNTLRIRYCASGYEGRISGSEKHLTVEVPKSVSLEIHCVSANIDCDSLTLGNRFDLKSVSGGVSLTRLDVPFAEVETVSGGIFLSAPDITSELTLSSLSGEIHVDSLTAGYLDARTLSGEIFAEIANCRDLAAESVSGSVVLSLTEWNMDKEKEKENDADSGDAPAIAPAIHSLALEFQTSLGQMITELPYEKEGVKTYFGASPDDVEESAKCYAQIVTGNGNLTVK